MYLLLHEHNASVNSSCTHPPSLGNCGAFAHLVIPGGGALANLAWPGGQASDYTRYYPRAFGTWFPTLNPIMEDPAVCRRLARRRLARPSELRTGQTCGGFLDFMHLFRDWVICELWSCELPVASCQLPVASCQLPVASCQRRVASCELPAASCQLRWKMV